MNSTYVCVLYSSKSTMGKGVKNTYYIYMCYKVPEHPKPADVTSLIQYIN